MYGFTRRIVDKLFQSFYAYLSASDMFVAIKTGTGCAL
jgi:hypothetical protein